MMKASAIMRSGRLRKTEEARNKGVFQEGEAALHPRLRLVDRIGPLSGPRGGIEHIRRHHKTCLSLGLVLHLLVVDGHLGLHLPGLALWRLVRGWPPCAGVVGVALDRAGYSQPDGECLQLALCGGLRIRLAGKCLIPHPQMLELALPLLAISLRPLGEGRARAAKPASVTTTIHRSRPWASSI
jgi:hypothetical protein